MLKLAATVVLLAYLAVLSTSNPTSRFFFYNEDLLQRSDLFEGDIQLDQSEAKGAYQIPSSSRENWPNGVVPYVIESSAGFTNDEITKIFDAMRRIESQTRVNGRDCIKFKPKENEATWISVTNQQGCWSYVGKQKASGAQQLSLQRPATPLSGHCVHVGTIMHEFNHALGFFHEHSRSDRDNYITINTENISPSSLHNFNKYTTTIDLLGEPYDLMSIMHYTADAFSINGKPTITPLDPSVVLLHSSKKSGFTDIDVNEIRKAYKCI